jgi:hypothetical protein
MLIDDVAADFPGLSIVLAHPSVPWQDEAISIATHKANVWIDLSGWAPKYFPPQLVRAANGPLRHKLLFGTDFPLITPERWLHDFEQLDLKPDVRPLILKENDVRLLGLARDADGAGGQGGVGMRTRAWGVLAGTAGADAPHATRGTSRAHGHLRRAGRARPPPGHGLRSLSASAAATESTYLGGQPTRAARDAGSRRCRRRRLGLVIARLAVPEIRHILDDTPASRRSCTGGGARRSGGGAAVAAAGVTGGLDVDGGTTSRRQRLRAAARQTSPADETRRAGRAQTTRACHVHLGHHRPAQGSRDQTRQHDVEQTTTS